MLNRSFTSSHSNAGGENVKKDDVDEEQLRTLWCGGLSEKVDEEILYELFLNAGPLERVTIPKDKETKKQKNYGFIVFQHAESTKYAYDLLNGTELFRQPIRLQNKETGLGMTDRYRSVSAGGSLISRYSIVNNNVDPQFKPPAPVVPAAYHPPAVVSNPFNSSPIPILGMGMGPLSNRGNMNRVRSTTAPAGGVQFNNFQQQQQPQVWNNGGYNNMQGGGYQVPYGYNMNGFNQQQQFNNQGFNNMQQQQFNNQGFNNMQQQQFNNQQFAVPNWSNDNNGRDNRGYNRDRDNRGSRDYSRDRDRDYGRERDRDRDYSRDRDRDYGRDRDRDRSYDRHRSSRR